MRAVECTPDPSGTWAAQGGIETDVGAELGPHGLLRPLFIAEALVFKRERN